MGPSRSLLRFAFVADSFNQTGDIVTGLEPLFAPILHGHIGERFDPSAFAEEVSKTYGVAMHPYVALDLAPKLAQSNLLRPIEAGGEIVGYWVIDNGYSFPAIKEELIESLTKKFFNFSDNRGMNREIKFSDEELEEALFRRLVTMDFLAIATLDQPSYLKSTTLSLKTKEAPNIEPISEDHRRQIHLDFLCADFVENLYRNDREGFELLVDVSCGALLAEVVFGLRTPPTSGQRGDDLSIFFDAPFVMDLLGLTEPLRQEYATLLFEAAQKTGATLGCFTHNIEEIQANIDAPLANLKARTEVFGPTGRMLLEGGAARAFVLSIRKDVSAAVRKLGLSILDMGVDEFQPSFKFFSEQHEDDLSQHLGNYQNIYARLRDAKSIANIVRLRGKKRLPATLFGCGAIFVTENSKLVTRTRNYLIREQRLSPGSFPLLVTDRFFAGVLWIAQGGKGADVPRKKLLANCTSAMAPRRDVVTKMYSFLQDLDPKKAEHFEALIANDRCSFYLMEQTLGDRDNLTLENYSAIYENVERATAEKIVVEKDTEIEALKRQHETEVSQIQDAAVAASQRSEDALESLAKDVEKLRSDTESLSDSLASEVAKGKDRDAQVLSHCIGEGYKAGRKFVIRIGAAFGVLSFLLLIALNMLPRITGYQTSPWAEIVLAIVALMGFLGFWRVPDFLLRGHLEKARYSAFRNATIELGLASVPERLQINWEARRILSPGTTHDNERT